MTFDKHVMSEKLAEQTAIKLGFGNNLKLLEVCLVETRAYQLFEVATLTSLLTKACSMKAPLYAFALKFHLFVALFMCVFLVTDKKCSIKCKTEGNGNFLY